MQKVNKKVKERANEVTRRHTQTGPQKIFQTDSRFEEDYSTTLVLMLAICPVPFLGKLDDAFRWPVLFYLSWYRGFILQDHFLLIAICCPGFSQHAHCFNPIAECAALLRAAYITDIVTVPSSLIHKSTKQMSEEYNM